MEKLRVRDLMTEDVFAVRPEDALDEVQTLMDNRGVRHIPVVDNDGDLLGLISHRDLLRSTVGEQPEGPRGMRREVLQRFNAQDIMTVNVESVDAEADIRAAAQLMYENKYGCLPVVEGTHLVGILTEADFVRLLAEGS